MPFTLGGTSKGLPKCCVYIGECTKGTRRDDIVLLQYTKPSSCGWYITVNPPVSFWFSLRPRDLRNVFIQNAPADPSNLFVRPEVREMSPGKCKADFWWRCLKTYAPGDALVECTNCWSTRLFSVPRGKPWNKLLMEEHTSKHVWTYSWFSTS